MEFGLHELIAHAARTRNLVAGTVIGTGTVSNDNFREIGSTCIAERRGIEVVDLGAAQTEFMIDNRVVTLGEWRAFAGKGYTYGVDALYAQKDKTLLTLVLNSAAKFDAARR